MRKANGCGNYPKDDTFVKVLLQKNESELYIDNNLYDNMIKNLPNYKQIIENEKVLLTGLYRIQL